MPIVVIEQKTALHLGYETYTPQKSFVDAGPSGAGAGAGAVHDLLVTLTCACQQTNTPKTHIILLQFTDAVCMQCIFFAELSWKSDINRNLLGEIVRFIFTCRSMVCWPLAKRFTRTAKQTFGTLGTRMYLMGVLFHIYLHTCTNQNLYIYINKSEFTGACSCDARFLRLYLEGVGGAGRGFLWLPKTVL